MKGDISVRQAGGERQNQSPPLATFFFFLSPTVSSVKDEHVQVVLHLPLWRTLGTATDAWGRKLR